jgi:Tfp pilus assembly protein PilV
MGQRSQMTRCMGAAPRQGFMAATLLSRHGSASKRRPLELFLVAGDVTLTTARPRASDQSGFSIVEVMIAALILLVVAIGILPMFMQSTLSNAQGQDSTSAANYARSRLEEFKQLPFTDTRFDILSGTERQFDEIYLFNARKWIDGTTPPGGDYPMWTRTTVVRQYQANNLDTPLPAATDPSFVQLKEVEVTVQSQRNRSGSTFTLGAGKKTSVRYYKAS